MARPGLSGIAVGTIAAGLIIMWSGLKNATVLDTVRALARGEPIPSAGSEIDAARAKVAGRVGGTITDLGTSVNGVGSATGAAVAAAAQRFLGVKYVWGGEDPVNGWDCSGFVTYILHHEFGLNLPDNNHTVTGGFYIWSGAITVPPAQCQAGDLVCWMSHIGIATDNQNMINAPGVGIPTRIQPIYWTPQPLIRRPIAYGAAPVVDGGKKGKS
jgi:cell wall-associated NlpC family hydrolase